MNILKKYNPKCLEVHLDARFIMSTSKYLSNNNGKFFSEQSSSFVQIKNPVIIIYENGLLSITGSKWYCEDLFEPYNIITSNFTLKWSDKI